MASGKRAALISVHLDLGAGRRGVDMGPSAMRIAGLDTQLGNLGWTVVDRGSVHVPSPEAAQVGREDARYLEEVRAVCEHLRDRTREALEADAMPLALGGDHAIAMGSVSAVAARHRERDAMPVGCLWVDAHTDMNIPETTPSGNIHGMPLAHLLGHGEPSLRSLSGDRPALAPEHVVVLGARSIDPTERDLVRRSGVRVMTMSEIDRRGIAACVAEAIERTTDGTAGLHLSFDLDGVDPRIAPGVGTPVQGGLTYREAHLVCEEVAASGALLAMDMVELNPVLDEGNRTGRFAVELIASALGKRIL